jgi:hypothetical protein
MNKSSAMIIVASLLALLGTGAEAKLYKWVDDQGVTHYGEVIPPQYADKERVQIDKGREIQKQEKKAAPNQDVKEDEATIERKRRDQALLGTFSSESEIDLALQRNLQPLNARTDGIRLSINTAQADLAGYQKEKAAMDKAGKPTDKILQQQIAQTTARIAKLQSELAESEKDVAAMKARYNADKQRYHELTSGAAGNTAQ